eukprot:CAMPEP_0175056316 /NCGR_PEP_ID=MMETSP0052_2-20121109/10599_1 /TAXON_ID=51329 ORGANISM="Polytomella parva, Strain SAG 63-3" /NCGR_SAMPLE_ID=MMETSP0052_2 /ASSEMBLY_ACC=CAM_ASM_000194 /LENGTH=400 /DNA_ID=CAMNT_0016321321 /DNA_START=140 /DNA_END=1342 /DNA_ORIENTATION=-
MTNTRLQGHAATATARPTDGFWVRNAALSEMRRLRRRMAGGDTKVTSRVIKASRKASALNLSLDGEEEEDEGERVESRNPMKRGKGFTVMASSRDVSNRDASSRWRDEEIERDVVDKLALEFRYMELREEERKARRGFLAFLDRDGNGIDGPRPCMVEPQAFREGQRAVKSTLLDSNRRGSRPLSAPVTKSSWIQKSSDEPSRHSLAARAAVAGSALLPLRLDPESLIDKSRFSESTRQMLMASRPFSARPWTLEEGANRMTNDDDDDDSAGDGDDGGDRSGSGGWERDNGRSFSGSEAGEDEGEDNEVNHRGGGERGGGERGGERGMVFRKFKYYSGGEGRSNKGEGRDGAEKPSFDTVVRLNEYGGLFSDVRPGKSVGNGSESLRGRGAGLGRKKHGQ